MFDIEYQQNAIDLLLPQFSESDNIKAILAGWLSPAPQFQKTVNDIIASRNIDTAEGTQLDLLGKLLNVYRMDMSDDDYRIDIKRQIIINRANGTLNNFIELMGLVLPEDAIYEVVESYPASFRVVIYTPQDVVNSSLVSAISPIGVSGIFLNNPYEDKVVWIPSDVGDPAPDDAAILPDVSEMATTNKTLIEVTFVTG